LINNKPPYNEGVYNFKYMIYIILLSLNLVASLYIIYKLYSNSTYDAQLAKRIASKKLEIEEMTLDSTIIAIEKGLVNLDSYTGQEEEVLENQEQQQPEAKLRSQIGYARHSNKETT